MVLCFICTANLRQSLCRRRNKPPFCPHEVVENPHFVRMTTPKIPPFCPHETPILSVYTYYSKKEIKNFDTKIIDSMAFGCLSNVFSVFFCSKAIFWG